MENQAQRKYRQSSGVSHAIPRPDLEMYIINRAVPV